MKCILIIGIIFLLVSLWIMRIKLKISKVSGNKVESCLIISNLFRYKIDLETFSSSETKGIKDVIKFIKNITNPTMLKIFSTSLVEKINIELSFKMDSNPYLIFAGHMLLLELRNLCYRRFKKIKKEKYKIVLEEENAKQEIIISINLGKLVTIILRDYSSFKQLFKTNVSRNC